MGALLCFIYSLMAACSREPASSVVPPAEISGSTMGTGYSLLVSGLTDSLQRDQLAADVETLLAEINSAMSTYDPDSQISGFNQKRSLDWYPVSPGFALVAQAALDLGRVSEGFLDVTIAPLVQRWGFGANEEPQNLPQADEVARLKASTGLELLEVRATPPALKKRISDLVIDLSAIAKGYAVDQLAMVVEAAGYTNYLVEIGGELRVRGQRADDQPWTIGIQQPDSAAVVESIPVSNTGIATSGNYRNFRIVDGQRYTHIIDPRSGYPITHNLASVSVLAKTAMLADGWATALLAAGPEQGAVLARQQQLAVWFIVKTEDSFVTRKSPAALEIESRLLKQ